jgi:glyoxalase family protein
MRLEGIHHITAITGDAPRNVEFYVGTLGLRMVKRTVNQDDPGVYHLFYGDEHGRPGADLTFFEYPGAAPGRTGPGMVHTVEWRVASDEAVAFWEDRLRAEGVEPVREGERLRFADPEGLHHELVIDTGDEEPLIAEAPDVPREMALRGFAGARAHPGGDPAMARALLERALEFEPLGEDGWRVAGEQRSSSFVFDPPPATAGRQGAGSVHHIAFASTPADHLAWRERVLEIGLRPTPVIDRFYFRSIYFQTPMGILFELATTDPGFAVDEPEEHLGERLSLPPAFEHLREQVERILTPLPDPRAARARSRGA